MVALSTNVSYVNNPVCLTMTVVPFILLPPLNLMSTWLPRARLPLPDSCFHCSCLLCLPKALLRCMAVRLDHQKWQCRIRIDYGPSADSYCSLLQTIKGRTEYGKGCKEMKWRRGARRNLHGKLLISNYLIIYYVLRQFTLIKKKKWIVTVL